MAAQKAAISALLAAGANTQALDNVWALYPQYDAMWVEYKAVYNKDYSGSEDNERLQTFRDTVERVRAVQAQNVTYTVDLTRFADALPSELFTLAHGAVAPSVSSNDAAYLGRHTWDGEPLPDSVDWTQKGAVTPAKDQKICGSCWAFSGVAALEGANAVATGNLLSLSEQQAMQCSNNDRGCDGGWPDYVFKYAVNNDMCTEDSYPYLGVETIPCFWQGSSCTAAIKKEQITGYKDVAVDSYEDLMSAVAQQPVAVVVGGSGHWGTYTGGVFTDCDVGVGHAVTLVGYGTDPSGGDYWKLKNSWGTSFGIDGGYILIGRNRGVKEGECGIAQHASYPVISADVVSV